MLNLFLRISSQYHFWVATLYELKDEEIGRKGGSDGGEQKEGRLNNGIEGRRVFECIYFLDISFYFWMASVLVSIFVNLMQAGIIWEE